MNYFTGLISARMSLKYMSLKVDIAEFFSTPAVVQTTKILSWIQPLGKL